MKGENGQNLMVKMQKRKGVRSAKECAYLSAFVALLVAMQLVLSIVPGVELVTVLFVAFSLVMGAKRAMFAATAFSLLRQFVFGFFPAVLLLYLIYFNLLGLCFGLLGRKWGLSGKTLPLFVVIACVCTMCFTLLDNVITPLWYAYTFEAAKAYFFASLPFLIPQVTCTAISVSLLLFPLGKAFLLVKKQLF